MFRLLCLTPCESSKDQSMSTLLGPRPSEMRFLNFSMGISKAWLKFYRILNENLNKSSHRDDVVFPCAERACGFINFGQSSYGSLRQINFPRMLQNHTDKIICTKLMRCLFFWTWLSFFCVSRNFFPLCYFSKFSNHDAPSLVGYAVFHY